MPLGGGHNLDLARGSTAVLEGRPFLILAVTLRVLASDSVSWRDCRNARRHPAARCSAASPQEGGRDKPALHRRRCGRRAAPWQWGSNSAPPPSLGRAPIPPEPSISKSGPRDLEFEYPGVVFKIERARYKID